MNRVLVFSSSPDESRRFADLVSTDDIRVIKSSSPLEVLHILKNEPVDIVLASENLSDVEKEVFRSMIESTSPGVKVMFVGIPSADGRIYFSSESIGQFLRDNVSLISSLRENIRGLKNFSISFTDRLLQIFEVEDKYFFNNCHLTAEFSEKIARQMGLGEEMVESIRMVALVKDLGRVGIQNELLEADRRFDQKEMISLKKHPLNTVEMLRHLNFPWTIESMIAQHHEHYDGSGYPMGLKGRQISIGARIIHIAESYVAMTADRPYRKALTKEQAMKEMVKKAGSQFDPEIAEIFLSILRDMPETEDKTSVLLIERSPNVASLLKLGIDASKMEVLAVSNSFDALRQARLRKPDLIIIDVEIFEADTFASFFGRLRRVHTVQDKPFMLIIPDESYAKRFEGQDIHNLTKPVDMNLLVSSINRILSGKKVRPETKEEPAAGLTGSLEDFGLDDIIQILSLGLKTAKVEVVSGVKKGIIYTEAGRVVYIATGESEGIDAFAEMVKWSDGSFLIRHGQKAPKTNINMNTMQLLLESTKAKDIRSA